MKALTLTQPWATLIAIGAKQYETRSWSTPYRGPLAIHASREMDQVAGRYPAFIDKLSAAGFQRKTDTLFKGAMPPSWTGIPVSAIVAVADLVACVRVETLEHAPIGVYEYAFGNFTPGRWAWRLDNVRLLAKPIPMRGARGLWDVEPKLMAEIAAQLENATR